MRNINGIFLLLSYACIIGVAVFIFFLVLPYDVYWAISLPVLIVILGFFLIRANEDVYDSLPIESNEQEKLKLTGNILHVGSQIFFRVLGAFFR